MAMDPQFLLVYWCNSPLGMSRTVHKKTEDKRIEDKIVNHSSPALDLQCDVYSLEY